MPKFVLLVTQRMRHRDYKQQLVQKSTICQNDTSPTTFRYIFLYFNKQQTIAVTHEN